MYTSYVFALLWAALADAAKSVKAEAHVSVDVSTQNKGDGATKRQSEEDHEKDKKPVESVDASTRNKGKGAKIRHSEEDHEKEKSGEPAEYTVSNKEDEFRNFHLHKGTKTSALGANWYNEDVRFSQDDHLFTIFQGLRFEWKIQHKTTKFSRGYPLQSPNPGSSLVHENTFESGYVYGSPTSLRDCLMRNLFDVHVLQGLTIVDMGDLPKPYLATQYMNCQEMYGNHVADVNLPLGVAARTWANEFVQDAMKLTEMLVDQFFFRISDRYDIGHADFAEEGMFFQVPPEFQEVFPYKVLDTAKSVVSSVGIVCYDDGQHESSIYSWWCRNASGVRKTQVTPFRIRILVLHSLTTMSHTFIANTAQDGILKAVHPKGIPLMVNALYPILSESFSWFMASSIRLQALNQIVEVINNFGHLSDSETYGATYNLMSEKNTVPLEWISGQVAVDSGSSYLLMVRLRYRMAAELSEIYRQGVPFGLSQTVEPSTIYKFMPSGLPSAYGFVEQASKDPDQDPCQVLDLSALGGSDYSQHAGTYAAFNPLAREVRFCHPGCLPGLGVQSAKVLGLSGLLCPEEDPVTKEALIRKLILRYKP